MLGDREDVDRLARAEERDDGLVDRAVALAVEVLLPQALLDDVGVVRPVGLQDRAEHGLLGLDRVRRGGAGRRAAAAGVEGWRGAHRVGSSKPGAPAGCRGRPRKSRAFLHSAAQSWNKGCRWAVTPGPPWTVSSPTGSCRTTRRSRPRSSATPRPGFPP